MSAAVMPIRSVPSAPAEPVSASDTATATREAMRRVMVILLGRWGCAPRAPGPVWTSVTSSRLARPAIDARGEGGDAGPEPFGHQVAAREVAAPHRVERRQGIQADGLDVRAAQG